MLSIRAEDCYDCVDVTLLPVQFIEWPSFVIVVASLLVVVFALNRRLRALRGPRGRAIEIAEYAPPEGLNVMVAAHLVRRSRTAVPAQLLELAVGKNLRVLEVDGEKRSYGVEFVSFDGADEIGQKLLSAIFSNQPTPGMVRQLRAGDDTLASSIAAVSAHAYGEARKRGWRQPAGLTQWGNLTIALFTALTLLFVVALSVLTTVTSPWLIAASITSVLALAISIASISLSGTLTPSGAEIRDHIRAIGTYLRLAEEDRLRILQSASAAERTDGPGSARVIRIYERLLPYAVVLGVDRSWISELIGNATDSDRPPEWVADTNLLSFLNVIGRAKIAVKAARLERAESLRQQPQA